MRNGIGDITVNYLRRHTISTALTAVGLSIGAHGAVDAAGYVNVGTPDFYDGEMVPSLNITAEMPKISVIREGILGSVLETAGISTFIWEMQNIRQDGIRKRKDIILAEDTPKELVLD